MRRIATVCALALCLLNRLPAEAPAPAGAADTFLALSTEYQRLTAEARSNYKAVKGDDRIDEEARKYRARIHQLETEYAPRFLAVAERLPDAPNAVDALVMAGRLGGGESPASEKALLRLQNEHATDAKLAGVVFEIAHSNWQGSDHFLRTVLEKNKDRAARGQAAYWLAFRLKGKSNDDLGTPDGEKAAKEAERLLELVIAKYGDVSGGPSGPLGKRAGLALAELQRLAVGHVAPDIEGVDIDGKPFKLSDYRGKVILLDFWGHWCPDCRAIYPRQRALVKRLEGKPFVLLGVNSDENKDQTRKVLEARGVTWRYWWDGGSRSGPIQTSWNIQGWPTLYIIDHKGVIRRKGHEELADKIDQIIEQLVAEAEATSPAGK